MRAIIYCRVSTKEQAEKGFSLEGQEKCREDWE
jgi:DNA invertase Pin-like site-specific DNA recombinase